MNTVFLYGKMLISMVISLYSTRLILVALGIEDYGIFNLVGGVIAMLSFLNVAMTVSTQRFFSFYLGTKEKHKLIQVFNSSVLLHLVIGFTIIIVLELIGIYLFNNVLNIPEERIGTAKIVYHFMVVSTFFTINAVPYDAAINAHENMLFDALTGIFESFVKLGIAIYLLNTVGDKLILYGLLIALLTIIIRIVKSVYCFINYKECRVRLKKYYNISLIREMFSFAGWNLFGSFCNVARNQGLAIILNLFFGVVVNAAFAVAHQVNAQLSAFSRNMLKALNPQIAKSEGAGDRVRMLRLATLASKFSFFLLSLFAIPLIIELTYVLNLWLKDVPEYTIIFCQLILFISLIQMLSVGLMSAIQSVGKIKGYQSTIGTLLLLNLPIAFLLLKLGFEPQSVLIGAIFLECIAGGVRIWFARRLAGLNAYDFLTGTVLRSVITFVITFSISFVPRLLFDESIFRVLLTSATCVISLFLFASLIALTSHENQRIKALFIDFRTKILSRSRKA